MANQEHLDILKQGVGRWNEWREKNPFTTPDLREADLRAADLIRANLRGADLRRAKLSLANLTAADLSKADLRGARVIGADLSGAHLLGAILSMADLRKADLREAWIGWTTFGDNDLSSTKGLETTIHGGPSTIGIDTIFRSGGNIPPIFLQRAGVPEVFITYIKSMVGKPIEFYSCFISYSTIDQEFAERLYADLQREGVTCWFAPEDLKIGDKFRDEIDRTIRRYEKLLIILSMHSIESDWVEKEVETAFEEERRRKTTVLFPVRVDNAVMETTKAWAADIRRARQIGDFTRWKDHDSYQKVFGRLVRDLKAGEKKEDSA